MLRVAGSSQNVNNILEGVVPDLIGMFVCVGMLVSVFVNALTLKFLVWGNVILQLFAYFCFLHCTFSFLNKVSPFHKHKILLLAVGGASW